jgi:hypothetical protein
MIDWRIQGVEIGICNCAWGCPCQFNALPTNGSCSASAAIHVDRGHFGSTSLDGLNFGGLFKWPGPIHEGKGEAQPLIDERATPEQRSAILTILSGQESLAGANMFSVFASTLTKLHDPVFLPFKFQVDIDKREGYFLVPEIVEGKAEPIRNPITGDAQRVQVNMPGGFEFTSAEFASGTLKTQKDAAIKLDWSGRHSHLCHLHLTGQGVVRN